jgi:hypothetical protein
MINIPLFSGLAAVKNIQVDLPIEALDRLMFIELHPLLKYPFDSVTFKFKGDRKTALTSLGIHSVYKFVFETNMTRGFPPECPRPWVCKAADALRTIHDQIDKSKEQPPGAFGRHATYPNQTSGAISRGRLYELEMPYVESVHTKTIQVVWDVRAHDIRESLRGFRYSYYHEAKKEFLERNDSYHPAVMIELMGKSDTFGQCELSSSTGWKLMPQVRGPGIFVRGECLMDLWRNLREGRYRVQEPWKG